MAAMTQAQGISLFNGRVYALEAKIAHIGAALACVTCAWKAGDPSPVSRGSIGAMRLWLGATAVAALAALPVAIASLLP